jgi:hypothetical protein
VGSKAGLADVVRGEISTLGGNETPDVQLRDLVTVLTCAYQVLRDLVTILTCALVPILTCAYQVLRDLVTILTCAFVTILTCAYQVLRDLVTILTCAYQVLRDLVTILTCAYQVLHPKKKNSCFVYVLESSERRCSTRLLGVLLAVTVYGVRRDLGEKLLLLLIIISN